MMHADLIDEQDLLSQLRLDVAGNASKPALRCAA